MIKLNQKNTFNFVIEYFSSINLKKDAEQVFNAKNFESALIIKLPVVCVLKKNRPLNSKGKQTHIHITGNHRNFFYDDYTLKHTISSSEDKKRNLTVSMANIHNLNNRTEENYSKINLSNSFTLTKIAVRYKQDLQVQISKIRQDGMEFIKLRDGLFKDDLLIFFKYRNIQKNGNEFFALGIPHDFYKNKYDIITETIENLEDNNTTTIKNAMSEIINSSKENDLISDVDEISDAVYQQLIDMQKDDIAEDPSYEPQQYIPKGNSNITSHRPHTNPKLGKNAIIRANYKCAFSSDDKPHETFIKENGKPYMEIHHLIPIKYQNAFSNKLDTDANLVPLCPLCHKKIHHGNSNDVKKMLVTLYNERKELLAKSGIGISIDKLLEYYNIK